MHSFGKNTNSNLLILGGLAAAAAILLMNRSGQGGGSGGGGGSTSAPFSGTDGTGIPQIFQLPSETFTGFPSPSDSGDVIGDLLRSLGGGYQVSAGTQATVKTPAGTGSGSGVAAVVTPASKKADAVALATKTAVNMTPGAMGINSQILGGMFGVPTYGDFVGMLAGALVGNNKGSAAVPMNAAAAEKSLPAPFRSTPSTGVQDFAGASVTEQVSSQSKKEAYVSGYSGQYINEGGVRYWNPYSGFGLSTDPATGELVPYQRDVAIYRGTDLVYSPDGSVGSKKDALFVADVSNDGWTSSRSDLDPQERYTSWLFTTGQYGQAWDEILGRNTTGSKKEAVIAATGGGGGGGTDWASVQSSATTAESFNDAVSSAWADSYGPGSGW